MMKSRFNLEVVNQAVVKWHERDARKGKLKGRSFLWELRRANTLLLFGLHYFFSSSNRLNLSEILLNHHKLLSLRSVDRLSELSLLQFIAEKKTLIVVARLLVLSAGQMMVNEVEGTFPRWFVSDAVDIPLIWERFGACGPQINGAICVCLQRRFEQQAENKVL